MEWLGNLLAYGAIGLGLALAILSFWLLSQEQKRTSPRRQIIRAIFVYMVFATVLTAGGFVAEYFKSGAADIKEVRAQLQEKAAKLSELEEKHRRLDQSLKMSHTFIQGVVEDKTGTLARLGTLNPNSPGYHDLVQEMKASLENADARIKQVLDELSASAVGRSFARAETAPGGVRRWGED